MDTPKSYLEAVATITHNGKRYPHRVGAAFLNSDGTIGVVLNSLPLDGRFVLRPVRPKSQSTPGGDSAE